MLRKCARRECVNYIIVIIINLTLKYSFTNMFLNWEVKFKSFWKIINAYLYSFLVGGRVDLCDFLFFFFFQVFILWCIAHMNANLSSHYSKNRWFCLMMRIKKVYVSNSRNNLIPLTTKIYFIIIWCNLDQFNRIFYHELTFSLSSKK